MVRHDGAIPAPGMAGGLCLVLPREPLPCLCMASGEQHLVCTLMGL